MNNISKSGHPSALRNKAQYVGHKSSNDPIGLSSLIKRIYAFIVYLKILQDHLVMGPLPFVSH